MSRQDVFTMEMTRGKSRFGCALLAIAASCGRTDPGVISGLRDETGVDDWDPSHQGGGGDRGAFHRSPSKGGTTTSTTGTNEKGGTTNSATKSSAGAGGAGAAGEAAGGSSGAAGEAAGGNSGAAGGSVSAGGAEGMIGGSGNSAGEADGGTAGGMIGCVGVERTRALAPMAGGSGGSAGVGGDSGGLDLSASSLPDRPAGRHVVLRLTPDLRDGASLATAGATLGLALSEGQRLRFGVNSDPSLRSVAWSFVDVAQLGDRVPVVSAMAGGDDGFDVVWTTGSSGTRELVYAHLATGGTLVEGPLVLAKEEGLSCSIAKSGDTVAVVCSQATRQSDRPRAVWVELCRKDSGCSRCTIADGPAQVSRPSVVWDGAAFDVVVSDAGSDGELLLARVSPTGELLQPLVPIADSSPVTSDPAAAWDGKNLVVVYGGIPTIALFDLKGVRTQGPWHPIDPLRYLVPLEYQYQLQLTPSGYAVFGVGQTELDVMGNWLNGTQLMVFDPSAPDRSKSLLIADWPVYGSIALVDNELIAIRNASGIPLGRYDPSTLASVSPPGMVFPEQPGALTPVGVHCDPTTCFVTAYEPSPEVVDTSPRVGVWQIDRASAKVTPPAPEDMAQGLPDEVPETRLERSTTVLQYTGSASPATIVTWNKAKKTSSDEWPVDPADPTEPDHIRAFLEENETTRLFYEKPVNGTPVLYQRPLVHGQWGAPVAAGAAGEVRQCGTAYVKLLGPTEQKKAAVMRWRPSIDPEFMPLFDTRFGELFSTWCCSDSVIAIQGRLDAPEPREELALYTTDGQLVGETAGWNSECVAAGSNLLLWPSDGSPEGLELHANGTLESFGLVAPGRLQPTSLAHGSGPWAVEVGPDTLAMAWPSVDDFATRLSVWRWP